MTVVTFIAPGLHGNRGGERVIHHYASALSRLGLTVNIMVPKGTCALPKDPSIGLIEYKPLLTNFLSHHLGYIDSLVSVVKLLPKDTDIVVATYIPQAVLGILLKLFYKKIEIVLYNQDFAEMFKWRPDRFLYFCVYPRFFKRIISISEFCRTQLVKYAGRDSVVINCGLENEFHQSPIPTYQTEERSGIFWLGTNNRHKGFKTFLEAIKIVRKTYPDIRVKILGGGFRLEESMEFVGKSGRLDSIKEIYNSSEIFVCSSLKEGFGLPGLEAMACGCPVVTTDTGGCNEYAIDQVNAFIVTPKDSQFLAARIIEILGSPELKSKFALAGLATAAKFQWEIREELFKNSVIGSPLSGSTNRPSSVID